LVSVAHIAASAFSVFSVFFTLFFPKLLFIECVAIAVPVGIVLSAWLGLLLKSLLPLG
jgi:hypothetical protein